MSSHNCCAEEPDLPDAVRVTPGKQRLCICCSNCGVGRCVELVAGGETLSTSPLSSTAQSPRLLSALPGNERGRGAGNGERICEWTRPCWACFSIQFKLLCDIWPSTHTEFGPGPFCSSSLQFRGMSPCFLWPVPFILG